MMNSEVLTPREEQVVALLYQGLKNPEISRALGISLQTAKTHAASIYGKKGVAGARQLMANRISELESRLERGAA